MPPKKQAKKNASKAYKLPDHIPPGQILTDVGRKQWRLGKSIGQGGFGEIYLSSDDIKKPVPDNANYVIKIEPHSNGPLFTEMHCYMRIAKPEFIENWKKEKKLKRLGMPKYLGSGSHEYNGQKYRFMVMERFGEDLQKIIEKHNKKFSYKTVYQVVIQIIPVTGHLHIFYHPKDLRLEVLEYIHHYEYIHADIKASNLLVGHRPGTENQVFLVDYGLACRYKIDGKHKEYKYDQRKAHDGTIEFTSRDAHIGAHSRRGDIEILGYNLVQWLCGRLPWEDKLQDCNYVANKKRAMMDDVPTFMKICFPDGVPPGVQEFMEYVASLTFDEKPDYEKFKHIMREGLKKRGYKDDGKLTFMTATPKAASRVPVPKITGRKVRTPVKAIVIPDSDEESEVLSSPPKRLKRSSSLVENNYEENESVIVKKTTKKTPVRVKRKSINIKGKSARKSPLKKPQARRSEKSANSVVKENKIVTRVTRAANKVKNAEKAKAPESHVCGISNPTPMIFNTRQYPKDEETEISLSKPSQSHYVVESDDIIIEKENQKMLERKKQLRPKRNMVKKDTSLDNPTPQMLEIMARMREKSISPPICTKRHRHNSNCQQGFRIAPEITSPPSKLTPAMEEVLKKRSNRRNSTDSIDSSSGSPYSPSMSPDLFDSGDETESTF
ncbi:Serine/threonine-protein kinase VRK1 [Armadillidium nasatum]|uniref:non-specific serine/threonine protein kinase n=1 Tax=Armadillidium nasatum TaxID=96803 RepID=A0A5N5TB07_9CRUS|nr:Serine/threonine-protein kinase VRK1 [Armadillidium nasatum]